jgi:hypothetical protein
MLAVCASADSEYYINTDSANTAVMPAGRVTVIAYSTYQLVFTNETALEVMDVVGF